MSLISRLLGRNEQAPPRERAEPTFSAASLENPSTPFSGSTFSSMDWVNSGAGPAVTEQTSMQVGAVFRCVSLVSGMVAGLPLNIYRDSDQDGRVELRNHRLAPFLTRSPSANSPMSSYVWREQWSIQEQLWGNHFSVILRDGAGRVSGFLPMLPWNSTVYRSTDGRNKYRFMLDDGNVRYYDQEDVIHIPGIGFDGIVGQSRIRKFAREAVSTAKTLSGQVNYVHENAARPSGMITLPKGVDVDQVRKVEAWFTANYAGRANAGKPIFMDPGTEWTSMQISATDMNTLGMMQYSNADICRFFGVPPHMIGETSASTTWGSGIEQMTLGFAIYTLEPILKRIEAELNLKLFTNSGVFVAFDRDALLAMDAVAMATVMQTRINSGLMTPNEGRRKLKLPAEPDGDILLVNSTMIPLSRAITGPPAPAVAEPKKEPADATP